MSKSKHPKWYNPTREDHWDEYYESFWRVFLPLMLLPLALVLVAIFNSLFRGVS